MARQLLQRNCAQVVRRIEGGRLGDDAKRPRKCNNLKRTKMKAGKPFHTYKASSPVFCCWACHECQGCDVSTFDIDTKDCKFYSGGDKQCRSNDCATCRTLCG